MQQKSMNNLNIEFIPLTAQELSEVRGGSFWSSIIMWFRCHFFKTKVDEYASE